MADKYPSTILVQKSDVLEIQRADLDLLKKINETNNRLTVSEELPTDEVGVDGDVWIQV